MNQFQKEHMVIAAVGYLTGIAVMTSVASTEIKRAQKREQRALNLAKGLVREAWEYLPSESKQKFNTEIEFFNILVQEDMA